MDGAAQGCLAASWMRRSMTHGGRQLPIHAYQPSRFLPNRTGQSPFTTTAGGGPPQHPYAKARPRLSPSPGSCVRRRGIVTTATHLRKPGRVSSPPFTVAGEVPAKAALTPLSEPLQWRAQAREGVWVFSPSWRRKWGCFSRRIPFGLDISHEAYKMSTALAKDFPRR